MACPSTLATMSLREAAMAALSALGVRPVGLGTTVTRLSAAAMASATSWVRSWDGPTARTTSISPGYCWART